jgi:hypothetical protein
MDLLNSTRMVAGYTIGRDSAGRESLVVAIKGTFRIPEEPGRSLTLDEVQLPLTMSDVFFGEPGFSAPRYEIDYSPRKLRCDVLLNGTAYAPDGRPTAKLQVGLRVGSWVKTFTVVGDRLWEAGLTGVGSGPVRPFLEMPITYGRAFGGVDNRSDDARDHVAFAHNPVGRGFHKRLKPEWIEGSPMPNTEETGVPVARPDGSYRPMSFGPIGRQWSQRARFAGTYDQQWLDEEFPFLPKDFDERYYQAAPEDQQLSIPVGEQIVTLLHLTRDAQRSFVLPHFEAPVHVFPRRGVREDLLGHLDTIVIEPDDLRVTMTWRATRPLRRDLFEIGQVVVGRPGAAWWQKRQTVIYPLIPVADLPSEAEGA